VRPIVRYSEVMVRLLSRASFLGAAAALALAACGSERSEAARSAPAAAVQEPAAPSPPALVAAPEPPPSTPAPEASLAAPDVPAGAAGAPVAAPDPSIPVGLFVGNRAPDFEAVDVQDKRFKLYDYRGKIVALDFWGFW
jgi:hypothetical protein